MPLHPQAQAELKLLADLGVPENHTQTPEQARLSHVSRRPANPPAPEPVYRGRIGRSPDPRVSSRFASTPRPMRSGCRC